jgi:hypothetical protein
VETATDAVVVASSDGQGQPASLGDEPKKTPLEGGAGIE